MSRGGWAAQRRVWLEPWGEGGVGRKALEEAVAESYPTLATRFKSHGKDLYGK